MLLSHLEGILNYCRVLVRFGVVEAVNGNIKALLRRGRGYKNLRCLLLKRSGWRQSRRNSSFSGKRRRKRALQIPAQSRFYFRPCGVIPNCRVLSNWL
jgi:hypothetical protein